MPFSYLNKLRHTRELHLVVDGPEARPCTEKTPFPLNVFLVFVPSLSWQNDRFSVQKWRPKRLKAFFLTFFQAVVHCLSRCPRLGGERIDHLLVLHAVCIECVLIDKTKHKNIYII